MSKAKDNLKANLLTDRKASDALKSKLKERRRCKKKQLKGFEPKTYMLEFGYFYHQVMYRGKDHLVDLLEYAKEVETEFVNTHDTALHSDFAFIRREIEQMISDFSRFEEKHNQLGKLLTDKFGYRQIIDEDWTHPDGTPFGFGGGR